MLIIAPQKAFLVDLKINNPSDTDTHYVRAVIKNAITGVVLDTLDLVDNGDRYFSKEWITPADITGTGLQISIFKTVYDDSAYSSESLSYGTLHETYIVREMPSPRMGFAGGSSSGSTVKHENVDYDRIAEIVKSLMPQHENQDANLEPILEAVEAVLRTYDYKSDISYLKDEIQAIKTVVNRPYPSQLGLLEKLFIRFKPKDTDLDGAVATLEQKYEEKLDSIKTLFSNLVNKLEEKNESIKTEIIDELKIKEKEPTSEELSEKKTKKKIRSKISKILGYNLDMEENPRMEIIKKLVYD